MTKSIFKLMEAAKTRYRERELDFLRNGMPRICNTQDILDVWVSADGKTIANREMVTGDKEYNPGEWYDFYGEKYRLGNFEKAHAALNNMNDKINSK